ncbi:MAG: hypothetical protein Q8R76_10335 [Candidatus Omnitrophota bacterium]|nr:hypothetical protein [Candidatus Omnitrophota bacterium]
MGYCAQKIRRFLVKEVLFKNERVEHFIRHGIVRHVKKIQNSFLKPPLYYFRNAPILRKLIEGRKVLIIGAGQSAAELGAIPGGVAVFTCNAGLGLLAEREFKGVVDLYYYHKRRDKWKTRGMEASVVKARINVLVMNNLRHIKDETRLQNAYSKAIADYNRNNFYLKRLIKPYRANDLKANDVTWSSAGMRLLQYALYFKAAEIYLIGIDMTDGYYWGEENARIQTQFDENLMKVLSRKFHNIYTLSKDSAMANYVPYKPLD